MAYRAHAIYLAVVLQAVVAHAFAPFRPYVTVNRFANNTFDAADRLISAQVRYGSHTNAPVGTYAMGGEGSFVGAEWSLTADVSILP